jgi:acetyl/propionyl-CoA carboxylase alpha subunit
MAGGTISVRDAQGTEYRIAISEGRVTVNDVELHAEQIDDATVRLQAPETADDNGTGARQALAYAVAAGGIQWVFVNGEVYRFEADQPGGRRKRTGSATGSLTAPMPATVRRIEVKPGQAVRRGELLIVLEAMKMELPVRAPADGTVARVNCREGDLVQPGQELAELQP